MSTDKSPAALTARSSRSSPGSACSHCRRIKECIRTSCIEIMRCDRTESSPCTRCKKAKRECIVASTSSSNIPGRSRNTSNLRSLSPAQVSNPGNSSQLEETASTIASPSHPSNVADVTYSASNMEPSNFSAHGSSELQTPRKMLGMQFISPLSSLGGQNWSGNDAQNQSNDEHQLSNRDVRELLAIFKARLLVFIPILREDELSHLDNPSEMHSRLAYCICYVTARLVPGYRHMRTKLFPLMEQIVNDGFKVDGDGKSRITHFYSLAILYALKEGNPLPWKGHPTESQHVNFWKVKSATENIGAQIALHASDGSDLHPTDGKTSVELRVKLYSLWLFSMSHRISIMTGMAPSIRSDSSIRQSCIVMKQHMNDPLIARQVAEAELCLLWEKVNFHSHTLGEWWVSPALFRSTHSEPRVFFDQITLLLEQWKQEISELLEGSFGSVLTLHFQFTKLCLETYYFRSLIHSTIEAPENEEIAIMRCVSSAAELLSLLLDCGPLATAQLQDSGSLVFVIFGFSCFFIIHAKQYRHTLDLENELRLVRSAAIFMTNLASDVNESSHLCGSSILQCLSSSTTNGITEPFGPSQGTSVDQAHNHASGSTYSIRNPSQIESEEDWMMSQSFDFTATLPEFFFNTTIYDNF